MKKNLSKLREASKNLLKAFHDIEAIKNKYILEKNLNIIVLFLKNTNYENLYVKVDKRSFNKNVYEKNKKELLSILKFKKNFNFLNEEEKHKVNSFLEKIFINFNYFDINHSIFPLIQVQKKIQDIIILTNYEFINKVVNEKRSNKLLQNKIDDLYLALIEELIISIYKFETNRNLKFITFFHNRTKTTISKLLNDAVKQYSIQNELDYTIPRYKLSEIEDPFFIKCQMEDYLNLLDLLEISFSDEFNTKYLTKEIAELLNSIIKNSSQIKFQTETYNVENPRQKVLNLFKEQYPTEYAEISSYTNTPFLQVRIIFDIIFFNKNLSDLTSASLVEQSTKKDYIEEEEFFEDLDRESLLTSIENKIRIDFLKNFSKNKFILKKMSEKDIKNAKKLLEMSDYSNEMLKKYSFSTPIIEEVREVFIGNEESFSKQTKKYLIKLFVEDQFYLNLIN